MKETASGLASLGRGPDTMLVHMSPREVAGLQSLAMAHGGSLTVNPHTGLPEAGFLENILPTVLGFALTPFLGPIGAGLAVGGVQAVRTGDIGKGLLAGLGAYGGAGMGEALSGLGQAASAGVGAMGPALPTTTAPVMGSQYLGDVASGLQTLGQQAATSPTQALSTAGSALKSAYGGPFGTAAAGIGSLGALGGFEQPEMMMPPQEQRSQARLSGPIRRPYDPTAPGGYYFTDRGMINPVYAAKGGEMHSVPRLEDGGFVLTKKAVDGLGDGDNKRGQRAAQAGLGAIPIRGPGTGTSDSIRTSIDGIRPAKVSNGEAYVPRKQVKRAGGAKKLYALMHQAEKAARSRAA